MYERERETRNNQVIIQELVISECDDLELNKHKVTKEIRDLKSA